MAGESGSGLPRLLEPVGMTLTTETGVSRFKVPGGWVIVSHKEGRMLFIQNPSHSWVLGE